MAPAKRKRSDRASADSGENRPSPHRPANTNLGQHDMRDGGGRRTSRGGQGGGRGRRNDGRDNRENSNKVPVSARATPTPGAMSPPPRPSSATQTPTPNVDPPSPVPKPDPIPFDYSILTEEAVSSWDTFGQQQVIAAGIQMRQDEDTTDLSALFQELLRATLDVRIDAAAAGNCVKEILGPDTAEEESENDFDPQTLFIDTFSMIVDAEPGATEPKTFPRALRSFAAATGISPITMRQKLDATLVQNLGLTRDTFIRVGIRQATHLLYRQANYNLLREETEGYSKLVTELFTTSGSEPPSAEVVEETFEKVKGLIGTFDLDVGRVLDITMDVFAAVLIKHFRFFIKLLRVSSWWPRNGETDSAAAARCAGLPKWALPSSPGWLSTEEDDELSKRQRAIRDTEFWARAREVGLDAFFELGGREVVDAETKQRLFRGDGDAELDADRQWIEGTGTFPPSGNRIAAQLLGFKLRFYASEARDKDDVLPSNLIYLTALLIKIGFISLRDLYPHLWPLDENMEKVREIKMKELEEKERLNRPGGSASNALMMAGALVDDTLPNNGRSRETPAAKADPVAKPADAEDKDKLDEPGDQKVQLLTCLLTIGAIPESLYILGRYPWLPEAYPDLLDLIHRILNHSISDVYDQCRPTTSKEHECKTKEVPDPDQGGVPKGEVRLVPTVLRKLLRWPFPDKHDTNEGNSYRFYWDEWADNVPVCQTVDDVFTLCGTLLNYSGVNIGKDSCLLSKLARIGAKSLATDASQSNLDRWQDLLKRLLVPALSLTKANTSVVNEIYDMLRFYPVSIRYLIYAEWFEGQISRLPAMKTAFARTRLETLSIMKRISMTNLTAMARSLSKVAFASPGIVFGVALSQIEAYTNLTEVVVECAKYFTDLGYDVLVWSLMSALGGKHRNRNNSEFALLPSRWLLALSRFSGKVFKRYSIMNISPIIQYVNDQLYRGNSTDLVILKELIAQMAGVVPDTDFTDAQLTAMTGGEILRKQTLINLQDKRYESLKTAKRLMKSLTDTKLAGQLLISIAQHRQSAIYSISDEDAHIKLLATMIDDTQLILFQYLDLLRSNLSVDEFDKHVPEIPELLTDFGLDPTLAFMIGRQSLSYRLSRMTSPVLNGTAEPLPTLPEPSAAKIDADGDVGMEGGEATTANSNKATGTPVAMTTGEPTTEKDVQMEEADESSPSPSGGDAADTTKDSLYKILEPIIATVQAVQPEGSWKAITPEFYVTFWTAALGDLALPNKSYETEMMRLANAYTPNRSDTKDEAIARKEAQKSADVVRLALMDEFGKEVGAYRLRKSRMLKRKSLWFEHAAKADVVSDAILEKCLIPRLLLSPSDADFAFKMVRFLHDNGTPSFRTLSLYGRLFRSNRLRSIIFTSTVREAENFGRFLRLVLADLMRWHKDAALYEKEAWGSKKDLLGFAKALDGDGKPKGLLEHDGKAAQDGKQPTNFKSVLLTWHKALNVAIRDCLDGKEWMHIRNAITILKCLVDVYPAIDFMGKGFIKQLEVVTKREKDVREDLSLTGNAVLVQLKKKSSKWVMIQAFSSNAVVPPQANGTTGKSSPPNGSTIKTTLKPTAPEFKPQSRASSMGVSTPKLHATAEVEDGEVDDAKTPSGAARQPISAPTSDATSTDKAAASTSEPRKSEVLVRREQILREKNTKIESTPPPTGIPPRPDPSRNPSNSFPERSNPLLPSKPDGPLPGRIPERDRHSAPRHGDRRDGRDSRTTDSGRLDRPSDRPGDRSRDFSLNDRRGTETGTRDFRSQDRAERDVRIPHPPPRWTPESARENQERAANGTRPSDGRLSRDSMPPPRPAAAPADRGPPVNPERLPLVNSERQEIINPERAALITGTKTPPRSNSPRRTRDDPRDRTSSRPQSPRRQGSDRDHPESRRDDRSNRNGTMDQRHIGVRIDGSQPPPAGPRSDRQADRINERLPMERQRDASAFQPTHTGLRSMDPDHGRLNSNIRQQPDPNFGRLNPAPQPDIPSGPRDRNPRGGRMVSAPQPRHDGRLPAEAPRPPTPERVVPTGPSSNRAPRRSASGQFDLGPNAPSSVPNTPLSATTPTGVHPDRLKHLPQAAQPSQPAVTTPTGIHPDRLKAFGNDNTLVQSVPQPNNNNRSRPPIPPVVTAGPPSGPKGSQSSPISAGVNGITAPTGPASAVERRGGRRQLAGINTMLQQAGQQNAPDRINVRGRVNRLNSSAQVEPNVSPATPVIAQPLPPPPPPLARTEPKRDISNPERADLITGNAPTGEDRERDRNGRRDRSGRHSRRSSRSPPGQDRSRDNERGSRDHRDRREGGRNDPVERERHGAREPSRDLMAGRDASGSGRDGGRDRDRERDRDPARRDGRDRDGARETHDPSWGGGGDRGGERGGRRSDVRGDPRGADDRRDRAGRGDDGGRKRHSEEGGPDRGREKRPRR